MNRFTMLTVLFAATGVASIEAQEKGQPGRTYVSYPDPLASLIEPDIQEKLNLSEDQRKVIKILQSDCQKAWKQQRQLRSQLLPGEYFQKWREATKPFVQPARDLLSDEQTELLSEIQFQGAAGVFSPVREFKDAKLQAELNLSSEQIESLDRLHNQFLDELRQYKNELDKERPPGQTWWESPFAKAAFRAGRDFEPRLRELRDQLLTEEQQARMTQIDWQRNCFDDGIKVLLRPEVAEYLQLTTAQLASMQKLSEDSKDLSADRGNVFVGRRKTLRKGIMLLTRDQKSRWDGMIGKPFGAGMIWLLEKPVKDGTESGGVKDR